jgi:hypothetical protein
MIAQLCRALTTLLLPSSALINMARPLKGRFFDGNSKVSQYYFLQYHVSSSAIASSCGVPCLPKFATIQQSFQANGSTFSHPAVALATQR